MGLVFPSALSSAPPARSKARDGNYWRALPPVCTDDWRSTALPTLSLINELQLTGKRRPDPLPPERPIPIIFSFDRVILGLIRIIFSLIGIMFGFDPIIFLFVQIIFGIDRDHLSFDRIIFGLIGIIFFFDPDHLGFHPDHPFLIGIIFGLIRIIFIFLPTIFS